MKNLLRWLIVIILLIVIVFLFINLFNRSKQDNTKSNKNSETPIVEEKKDEPKLIVPEKKEEQPVIEEQIVEVQDTADFATISVFIGVFTIAAGVYCFKLYTAK